MEKGERLNFVLKREIVQRLAKFDTPTAIAKAMKADHGIELSLPRILCYDPTSKNGAALSEDLKVLFHDTRAAFIKDVDGIGGAHRAVRLRRLDRMAITAEERGNLVLAAALNEQLAKEAGDAFTNRHKLEHTGKDGAPMQSVVMTGDEFEAIARKVADEV